MFPSMKQVIATTTVLYLYIISAWMSSPVCSHIIGGSYNTDFHEIQTGEAVADGESANQATLRRRYAEEIRRRNIDFRLGRLGSHSGRHRNYLLPRHSASSSNVIENELLGEAVVHLLHSRSIGGLNSRSRRAVTAGGSTTATKRKPSLGLEQNDLQTDRQPDLGNPFLRVRRDAASSNQSCPLPVDLPAQVAQLNSFLTYSKYIGVLPDQDGLSPLPSNQPENSCPALHGSWWPNRHEFNLRSTCPWIWESLPLGDDAYPRELRQAKCMCKKCLGADTYACQELKYNVTFFRKRGCQNGLAVLEKDVRTVTQGCYCAAPVPNAPADQSASGPGGDYDMPISIV